MSEKRDNKDRNQGLGLKDESFYELGGVVERIQNRKLEMIEKRKREKRKRIIILSSVLVVIGLIIFSFTSFFTVDYIEVRGCSYFSEEEVINMAHAEPGKNLIYHPDKRNIVNHLEENPYIKSAEVSRGLPSTLIITVNERKQIGAIKYDDDFLIIDSEGMLLRKTNTIPKITTIEGIVVKKIKVGEKIEVKDETEFDQALNILKTMQEKDLYFTNLDMKEMYIKAYIYKNLVCKGTYEQLMDAMKKDRLHKVLEKLFKNGIKRGTITFTDNHYASFVPTV